MRYAAAATACLVTTLGGLARGQSIPCLGDEFDHASTLGAWSRVHITEQWNADQLEQYGVDTLEAGRMVMIPYTCTWYRDYRGPLSYKEVSGDFAITTDVRVTGRDGSGSPEAYFSLGGIMIRTPRNITPATWTTGGENYVFLSLGYGQDSTIHYQYEVKTTLNGNSVLQLSTAPGPSAKLQIARIGRYVITLLQNPGGSWVVRERYDRPDFPAALQAGMVAYTDWNKVQYFDPFVHNQTVLTPPLPGDPNPGVPFSPDLVASFDYARFAPVTLPGSLVGRDLTNRSDVPDSALLAFLGEHAAIAGPVPVEIVDGPDDVEAGAGDSAQFSVTVSGDSPGYQWLRDGVPLADGLQGSGAVVSGAHTQSLTIQGLTVDENGMMISCRVEGPCTEAVSTAAHLGVRCPSDFDGSGFVDTDDFDAFVGAFTAGIDEADFDGSGFVDTDDFDGFVHAFESGC